MGNVHMWRVEEFLYSEIAIHIYCIFSFFSSHPQMKMLTIKHRMEKKMEEYFRWIIKAQSKPAWLWYEFKYLYTLLKQPLGVCLVYLYAFLTPSQTFLSFVSANEWEQNNDNDEKSKSSPQSHSEKDTFLDRNNNVIVYCQCSPWIHWKS